MQRDAAHFASKQERVFTRDISPRKDRIVYCSAVKSGRGAGAVGVDGGHIKSGRNDDIEGERERERGEEQGIKCRNIQQRRSGVNRWRSCVFLHREKRWL